MVFFGQQTLQGVCVKNTINSTWPYLVL